MLTKQTNLLRNIFLSSTNNIMMVGVSATISQLSPKKDKLRSQDLKCRLHFEDKLSNCKLPVCISSSVRFFVYLRKDLSLFLFPRPQQSSPLSLPCQEGREADLGLSVIYLFFEGNRWCDTRSSVIFTADSLEGYLLTLDPVLVRHVSCRKDLALGPPLLPLQ